VGVDVGVAVTCWACTASGVAWTNCSSSPHATRTLPHVGTRARDYTQLPLLGITCKQVTTKTQLLES
jgi:hypothetical protein